MAAKPIITINHLKYLNEGDYVTCEFLDAATGLLNGAVGKTIGLFGNYNPHGSGTIWSIKLKINDVSYTAGLDGTGVWNIDLPANTFVADSVGNISVESASCNGKLAAPLPNHTVTVGSPGV